MISNQATTEIKTPYTVNLADGDPEAKREEIRRYFHQTYDAYEALFEPMVDKKAFTTRADPLRHPLIFYYGHTATFFMNKLVLAKLVDRINPQFESTFAIGVDEMSWDDLNEAHYEWPDPDAVRDYRQKVRETIDQLISKLPITLPISWESPFWPILMGIEHERIHLETSSVLIRQLPLEMLDGAHPLWKVCEKDNPPPSNELITVPGGKVSLGKNRNDPYYGWDNEYGAHTQEIKDFAASKYLVSNREYMEFIDDGGYATQRYWTDEGWNWVTYEKATCPRFWRPQPDGSYKLRTMLKEIDMPWSWPAETNYLEAKAFCNWKAEKTGQPVRLPTEEEWYRLFDYTELPDAPSWNKAPGNINLEGPASSVPVDTHAFKHGFHDIVGNVWQHTETPIRGFAGFEVHPLYDDFSTPTFDTKHNLIKGGSWISTGNECLKASRYAFRRHFYQHAGFRYIVSDAPVEIPDDSWETDPEVIPYCEFNYGKDYFGVANYPERLAQICLDLASDRRRESALALGCKTGRSAFELAAGFQNVTGMDFTARMIRIGVQMKDKGYTQYVLPEEGEIVSFHQANLQELGLDGTRQKVDFMQGDPSNLKDIYKGYDLILLDTVLERTYNPEKFLASAHQRLNPGGLLVISSTYDWRSEVTEKDNWLGGFKVDGENVTSLDSLERVLGPAFKRIGEPRDVEYALRKTARTFEHNVTQVTVWEKK
ncbi:5-histidylcysteine sulfoxide synthase [Pelagicoccus sp. SDUM812003]|uniref:5-histidylcysteine sulfoxide synthase n=1 Tax=Pelagicoccus sp. SDUM812003 TaxID=3041267 RepID=UPI0028100EED|nr:5-histidylcysteine sulfoxide synthase [Pelagicoccus sp. SDUM812003]MDQ8202025.1 5-histidylcysteine sulfoxide synthase [Pelagicoccus sp. SDUM812003]